ncbi:MAG TPA: DUF1295 domain-containing protein, partial [Acidimicrobiales bacterium]|nr:DUF1295 domain-containing protein [Acidimicrobiales bacterium]
MTGFAGGPFLTGLAVTAGVELVAFVVTWLVGRAVGRWNVVDVTWGLSFALVAGTSFGWSQRVPHLPVTSRVLALGLTVVWGLRLAGYIARRSRGAGEDPRYASILDPANGDPARRVLTVVMLSQAFLSWLVSMPVQVTMYERGGSSPLTWVGAAVWAVGVLFEAFGDAQMAAFRRQPANRGQVMDRGLWRYTRHPNYFGDACVWTGLWLGATAHWPGVVTVVSPLAMLYFLYFKSGKGLLERNMADSKPGYREYMRRTSG